MQTAWCLVIPAYYLYNVTPVQFSTIFLSENIEASVVFEIQAIKKIRLCANYTSDDQRGNKTIFFRCFQTQV